MAANSSRKDAKAQKRAADDSHSLLSALNCLLYISTRAM